MNRLRPYIPLIGFVVPTVVVGYGVVIPRSCIAGVNELTIGFGTTILGAMFTYVAGQRVVLPRDASSRPPRWARVARMINRQAASPSGWFGRLLGWVWRREHARLNLEVLDLLAARDGHRVLEVGCGPGEALTEVARRARGSRIVGVDISPVMAEVALRRSQRAVARGEIEVLLGDVGDVDLATSSFDRIFSVHSIYFWMDSGAVLAKLADSLAPGGRLVLAFRPEADDIPRRFRGPTYRFPRIPDLVASLEGLGLVVEQVSPSATAPTTVLLSAARPG